MLEFMIDARVERIGKGYLLELECMPLQGSPFYIRLESAFTYQEASGLEQRLITPEHQDIAALAERLRGHLILDANITPSGALHLRISPEQFISIPTDENYEAWTISRDDGAMWVCMPGGTVAIWDARQKSP